MRRPFLVTLALAVLAACTEREAPPPAAPEAPPTTGATHYSPVNTADEHRVSELAQLMRDMVLFSDSTKARLQRGADLLPKPTSFQRILTAESTPGMVDHRIFDPLAMAYLRQLDSLYRVPAAQQGEAFDGLIQFCAGCHGNVCPGPLTRINKLHLDH